MDRTQHKSSAREIFRLAWPTMVEQFLQTIVIYINTAMVGALGEKASAAIGITGTTTWLLMSPAWALGVCTTACISRAVGENDPRLVRSYTSQALKVSVVLSIIVTILILTLSPYIPGWLGAEKDIQADASRYFSLVCAPYLFNVLNIIFSAVLRGAGDTRSTMNVNLIINIVHVIFNFFFIYPTRTISILGLSFDMFGFGLEVAGAGLSTAITYVLGGILMILSYLKHPILHSKGDRLFIKDNDSLKYMIAMAIPLVLTRIISSAGQVVFTGLVASLGTTVFAAHSIALTAEEAFYIPGFGMQSAAISLTGNAIGERNREKMRTNSRMLMIISSSLMAVTGALLFIFSRNMMTLFSPDAAVIDYGAAALKIVAISEPVFGLSIILEGIFNGAGDTRHPLIYASLSMWGIRILGTYLCVNVFGLGLNAVWLCMVGDNTIRGILLFVKYLRTDLFSLSLKDQPSL